MMLLGRLATYKYMDMDVTVAAAIMRLQNLGMTV
jgi:UDP-galactopyranose mutase